MTFALPSSDRVKSESINWLVIGENSAYIDGNAIVNGNSGYKYRLNIFDAKSGLLEVRIWNEYRSYEHPNFTTDVIGLTKGNIKLH